MSTSRGSGIDLPNYPAFSTRYISEVLDRDTVLLVGERDHRVLQGVVYADLVPRLTGTNTADDIVSSLADRHAPALVYDALYWLNRARLLEHSRPAPLPVFRVDVAADLELDVIDVLRTAGLSIGDGGDVGLVIVDDYLNGALRAINDRAIAENRSWVIAKPAGDEIWIGPLFSPGGGCWECLAHRLERTHPARRFLGARHGAIPSPAITPRARVHAGLSLIALELSRGETGMARLHHALVSIHLAGGRRDRHWFARRPECSVCGDPQVYTDRASAPVRLATQTPAGERDPRKLLRESLRRLSRHTSVITGIVTPPQTMRLGNSRDIFYCVNRARIAHLSLDSARFPERTETHAAGKGESLRAARVAALGESIEHFSGYLHGDEPRLRGAFGDIPNAIAPNDCQHFSDAQLDDRDRLNAIAFGDYVPPRFDKAAPMDWTPLWSLTRERQVHLPTAMLYYDESADRRNGYVAESNGAAAGPTLADAVLHGLLELVERDCVAIWWYNRIQRPGISMHNLDDRLSRRLRRVYRRLGREWWLLDLSTDIGIACFAAVSRRTSGPEEILFGFGAHLDPAVAMRRAMCEMNQIVVFRHNDGTFLTGDNPLSRWVSPNGGRIAEHQHLSPLPDAPWAPPSPPPIEGAADAVAWCCRRLAEHDMEVLVLDQTRPEIDVPVARVVVPALRHFRPRFGPGRLYDVPVRLGWRAVPTPEEVMNPLPMFI